MATRRLSYLPEGGGKYFAEGDLALREVTRAIRLSRLPPGNVPLMLDARQPNNDRYGKYEGPLVPVEMNSDGEVV